VLPNGGEHSGRLLPDFVAAGSTVTTSRHKLGVTFGVLTLLLLLLSAGFGIYQWTHRPHRVAFQQIEIKGITDTGDVSAIAFSPDAKYVAYLRREENGRRGLWMRHIPTNTTRPESASGGREK